MTLLLQEGIFAVMFDWLGINEYVVKVVAAVIVVIINFFLGKLIFRKRESAAGTEEDREESGENNFADPGNGTERN